MNANIQWLGDGDVGQRLPQCPIGYYWTGTGCLLVAHPSCPSGQYWDGTKCVVSTGPALRAAPKVYATIQLNPYRYAVASGTTGQGAVNAARNYANSNGIRIASGVGTITFFANTPAQVTALAQILHLAVPLYGAPETFTPTRGVSGPTTGQLGNPDAGVSLSIGVGGLLLFGLAAYGVWRLARG